MPIDFDVRITEQTIRNSLSSSDVKYRRFYRAEIAYCLCYIETLVESETIHHYLLEPFLSSDNPSIEDAIPILQITKIDNYTDIYNALVQGNAVLLCDDTDIAYSFPVQTTESRAVSVSDMEKVTTGAHDSFNESLSTNISLVRRRLKTTDLVIHEVTFGTANQFQGYSLHLSTVASPDIVDRAYAKLDKISSYPIQHPGQIYNELEDAAYSPAPQTIRTESPDRTVGHLLEGKMALMLHNEPTAIIFPTTLYDYFKSPEDKSSRWLTSTFFYMLRLAISSLALVLPGIYVAINAFHSDILPLPLFHTLKLSVQFVPFPPLIEAIIMFFVFELLREASIRLPAPTGLTIGSVGGIVMGTALIQTNIISNSIVVVISVAALSSFAVPLREMSSSIRLMSIPITILASIFGFFGISFGMMIYITHLFSLQMFGQPYFENPNIKKLFPKFRLRLKRG